VRRHVAPLEVGEVAAAVDAGRALAAEAAADGITVITGTAPEADPAHVAALAGADPADGPLRRLRLHGGSDLAVLCGMALGAGEQGLTFACGDAAAQAAAEIAVGVEPDLAQQVR